MRTAIITALILTSFSAVAGPANPRWNPAWEPYDVCREAEGEVISDATPDDARAAALNMCIAAIKAGATDATCEGEGAKTPAKFRNLAVYLCKSAVIIGTQ
jgi:hypothetical protein